MARGLGIMKYIYILIFEVNINRLNMRRTISKYSIIKLTLLSLYGFIK